MWCTATLDGVPNKLTNTLQLLTSAQGHQPKGQQVLWRWDSQKGGKQVSQVSPQCQCAHMNICAWILIMKHNTSIIPEGSRLQPQDVLGASGVCFEAAHQWVFSEWIPPPRHVTSPFIVKSHMMLQWHHNAPFRCYTTLPRQHGCWCILMMRQQCVDIEIVKIGQGDGGRPWLIILAWSHRQASARSATYICWLLF